MKWLRRLLITLGVLGILGVIIVDVGRRFLASHYVSEKVAARLAQAVGAPVQLNKIDVGLHGSSVEGLRLYPPDSDPSTAQPWIVVKEVHTDVSLWSVLRGEAFPRRLIVSGAVITLHFDKTGTLLTRLPDQSGEHSLLDKVQVAQSELIIDQEGRPPLKITGISGAMHSKNGKLVVTGQIDDPTWGEWTLQADWNQEQAHGSATLNCSRLTLVQSRLETLPFVPTSVWHEVKDVAGAARVRFQLTVSGPSHKIQYHLTTEPINLAVQVPSADLRTVFERGSVVVSDNHVQLNDVVGETAGGEVRASGEIDFRKASRGRQPPDSLVQMPPDSRENPGADAPGSLVRMQFNVKASNLDIARLPRKWGLPREITGHLNGKAKLELTVADGRVQTNGEGRAVIKDARVAGNPAEPIELILRPSGQGFRFSSPTAATTTDPKTLAALSTLLVADPPPAPPPQPSYLEIKLGLDKVDLATLVEKLQVKLPFAVAGQLTFHLQVAIPTNMPRDLKAYRLQGTASLTWFTLERLRLENVAARVKYDNGVLQLEELKGQVPNAGAAPGSFTGSSRVELYPPGQFSARLTLQRLPLTRLAGVVPGAAEHVAGVFNGTATVSAPANRLQSVKDWVANATLQAEKLQVFGIASESLSARVSLKTGQFDVADLKGTIKGGPVSGSGGLNLEPPYRCKANLDLQNIDLALWQRIHPALRPPIPIQGRFHLGMKASGTLKPFDVTAGGDAGASELTVDRLTVNRVDFHWEGNSKQLTLSKLSASLYRGEVTGAAAIPLQRAEAGSIAVDLKGIDLGGLVRSLPALPVRLDGKASGSVEANAPAVPDGAERIWTGKVKIHSSQLKIQGIPAQAVEGQVTYKQQVAGYHLEGETLGGTFNLDGELPLPGRPGRPAQPAAPPSHPQPPEGRGRFRLAGVELSRVWALYGLQPRLGPLRGSVDAELNYRQQADGLPTGRGSFTLHDLRWRETFFTEADLPGWLVLERNQLRLGLRTGELGGELRLWVAMKLQQAELGRLTLSLTDVDSGRLLLPWPEWSSRIRGRLAVHLESSLGPPLTGSGVVSLVDGTVYGIPVQQCRLPVDFSWSPLEQSGQVNVHDSAAHLLAGSVAGSGRLTFGSDSQLSGRVKFYRVGVPELLRHSSLTRYASGQVSGDIEVAGSNVRSFGDLTFRINAALHQTQALQLPVLGELTPFLFGLTAVTVFHEGQLRAILSHDVLRIERLTLRSALLHLFLRGSVTIPAGRLDLGANVDSRALHLRITGTYQRPDIQLQPFRLLFQ